MIRQKVLKENKLQRLTILAASVLTTGVPKHPRAPYTTKILVSKFSICTFSGHGRLVEKFGEYRIFLFSEMTA